MINRVSKTMNYLEIAETVSHRSTCIRRHYGAVIVKNDVIISTGYNGSPRGKTNCCDIGICNREGHSHNDGDYNTCPAVHAEQNAIIAVDREKMIGSTLYLYGEEADGTPISATPCPICTNLIWNSGISEVVVYADSNKNSIKRIPFNMQYK